MKKQIAAIALATTLGLSIQPIIGAAETTQNAQAAEKNGWIGENGTWYFYEKGVKKTGWVTDNGKTYYFDPKANGALKTRWLEENGKTYYFDINNGTLRTGWVQDEGKMYYMDLSSGVMRTGWVWIEETGKMYYFDSKGVLQTGWVQIDGTMYYFDLSNGTLKTGWLEENGKTYYFDPNNGKLKTGWLDLNGKTYYFDLSYGYMVTGQVTIEGKTYNFANNGELQNEVANKADKIITEAKKHIGKPYVWGANGPNSFDCSGFISYVFNHAGYPVSRTTAQGLYDKSSKVTNPQPGDLVFFHSTYSPGPYITHVGIYIGNNKMVDAGGDHVDIRDLNSSYNRSHFAGYGRI